MHATIYLGNRDAVEVITDESGGRTRRPLPGKRYTLVQTPPDGMGMAEFIHTLTTSGGIWAEMSDGTPAWVAVDAPGDPVMGDALALILSQHWGGIEIREPDPDHQPTADVPVEG